MDVPMLLESSQIDKRIGNNYIEHNDSQRNKQRNSFVDYILFLPSRTVSILIGNHINKALTIAVASLIVGRNG